MSGTAEGDAPAPPTEQAVAAPLLDYLRGVLNCPDLSYLETPARVMGGFDTSIFRFELAGAAGPMRGPLILRLFAPPEIPERARLEAAIQNGVAELDYPAPRVFLTETDKRILGGAFLIMERMPGHMLTQGLAGLGRGRGAGELIRLLPRMPAMLRRLSTMMAAAQLRLHRLPVEPVLRAVESAGLPARAISFEGKLDWLRLMAAGAELAGLLPVFDWLAANQPPQPRLAICHCDFHPFNILVDGGRVSGVVDWSNTTIGDPALDLGFTIGDIATVPLEVPRAMQPLFRATMKAAGRSYYRSYCRMNPLDDEAVCYYQVFGCTSQLTYACDAIVHGYGSRAFAPAAGITRLVRHIRSLSGVKLKLDRFSSSAAN